MFQERQYHRPAALGSDRPACLGWRWGLPGRAGGACRCPWSCSKGCAGNAGTLLVPVKRLPQILNQIKDCEGVGVEAETDAKHAGCWRGGPEKRSTSQFLEPGDPRAATTTAHLPAGPPPGSPSSSSPCLPVPRQCLLLPTLLIPRRSRESVSGPGTSERSRAGLAGSWDFSPGGLSGVLSWTPGTRPLV